MKIEDFALAEPGVLFELGKTPEDPRPKKPPTLVEMERERDRQDAEYRAAIVRIAHTLEQILEIMKSREIRDTFK